MSELVPIPSPGVPLLFGTPGNPAVVVLHDRFGRVPGLVNYSEALASRGFRVSVPDLFGGVCTVDPATADELMGALDIGVALAEIDDSMAGAQLTGDERVGLVGFDIGGWLALVHAQAGAADAVVSYYASLSAADHGIIPCPVLLHWAETDEWDSGDDPASFVARLRDHGTPVTEHTYAGTVHSFANASVTETVDARAAALAYARTAVFLEKHLGE
ncbi:carboxymethylenebutenolidase [Microbacteriaceae bacterium SG_E_30_P1]|uniref:Carboxymethylenebutenolidase n=1 Tax=Antiquaquibacter oligotrophicus TaxID=2880260 RepID=A0ABT6KR48_9MICO|nr:dienelactone hydrolase family protein [Antiquaquibacter oligotrophicus]MDH6182443.1 carboxymethylenebutenolidase [Antiquaquibacter oligotrophicus]UDF14586.1 dienelactone hydrolase family protein [Antiquaquibacter oligotrophicus]